MEKRKSRIVKGKGGIILTNKELPDNTLSPSQINTLESCEFKWFQRYVEGIKIPPDVNLMFGSSIDDAFTNNYYQKIESKVDMPKSDILDVFSTAFETRKLESVIEPGTNLGKLKEMGYGLLDASYLALMKQVKPVNVQVEYNVKFPGVNWVLMAVADVEEKFSTRDVKTTARTPSKVGNRYVVSPYYRFQLTTYSIARQFTEKKQRFDLYDDFLVKTKTPKIVSVKLPPLTDRDIKFFQKKTEQSFAKMEALRNGVIPPGTNRDHFLCSRSKCGFWTICEKANGGRVRD